MVPRGSTLSSSALHCDKFCKNASTWSRYSIAFFILGLLVCLSIFSTLHGNFSCWYESTNALNLLKSKSCIAFPSIFNRTISRIAAIQWMVCSILILFISESIFFPMSLEFWTQHTTTNDKDLREIMWKEEINKHTDRPFQWSSFSMSRFVQFRAFYFVDGPALYVALPSYVVGNSGIVHQTQPGTIAGLSLDRRRIFLRGFAQWICKCLRNPCEAELIFFKKIKVGTKQLQSIWKFPLRGVTNYLSYHGWNQVKFLGHGDPNEIDHIAPKFARVIAICIGSSYFCLFLWVANFFLLIVEPENDMQ